MTTTVKVQAHCDDQTEVVVQVTGQPDTILEDGNEREFSAFDEQTVTVSERPKQNASS